MYLSIYPVIFHRRPKYNWNAQILSNALQKITYPASIILPNTWLRSEPLSFFCALIMVSQHYDVIKRKYFPRYWPFVRGIYRSPVNSPHKGQWRRALVFSLIFVWINGWVNNREAGDLRWHRAHYDVTVINHACKDTFAVIREIK